jgi:hypothetical protein
MESMLNLRSESKESMLLQASFRVLFKGRAFDVARKIMEFMLLQETFCVLFKWRALCSPQNHGIHAFTSNIPRSFQRACFV